MSNDSLPDIIAALIDQHGEKAVLFEVRHSINRGTHAGYSWHQSNKSNPCDECKAAESVYQTERQRVNRVRRLSDVK